MAIQNNDPAARKIAQQAAKDYLSGKRVPSGLIPAPHTHTPTDPNLAKAQGMADYIAYRLNQAGVEAPQEGSFIKQTIQKYAQTVAATYFPLTNKKAYDNEKSYLSTQSRDVVDSYETLRQARVDNYEAKHNLSITDKVKATAKASVVDYLTPGGMASTAATASSIAKAVTAATTKTVTSKLPYTMPAVAKGASAVSKTALIKVASVASLLGLDAVAVACTPEEKKPKETAVIPDWMKSKFGINGKYSEVSKETLSKALDYCNARIKEESNVLHYTDRQGKKHELTGPAAEAHKNKLMQYQAYALELRNVLVPPTWMLKKYFKFDKDGNIDLSKVDMTHLKTVQNHAHKMAVNYRHILNKGADVYVDGKGQKHHIDDAQIQLAQYKRLEELCVSAQKQLKANAQAAAEEAKADQEALRQQNVGTNKYAGDGYSSTSVNSEAPQQSANATTSTGSNTTGWEQALFGDLSMNNIGSTIASLPDAMVSMLSGTSNTMGMNKSTLMPIAALFGAYFLHNPLLKLLCGTMGVTGLLKNTAKENNVLEDQKNNPTSYSQANQYKRYADEQLNPRVNIKGINGQTIVMDIDNVPHTIVIPTQAAEAYAQGSLPLNTLANAVLQKYDERNQTAQQAFDQSRQAQEEQGRTIHR